MDATELRERIAAFPRWHHRFEFEGGLSTSAGDRGRDNRQAQRYEYFFARLLQATGGTLRGMRVLDLGCNAGFWSLSAIDAGADFVLGVDLMAEYVEQAQLVFAAKAIAPERYCFEQGDALTREAGGDGEFDVVLCLGLLDHTDRPVELFDAIARARARFLVIDTNVSRARTSLFETTRLYDARDVPGDGLVLIPSRRAVADLAARHGYSCVALAPNWSDPLGMSDYRRERRCAFICARERDQLAGLPVERRPRLVPWWLRDPRALTGT
jgi:tRNA (mo5U34)-methyltransferase